MNEAQFSVSCLRLLCKTPMRRLPFLRIMMGIHELFWSLVFIQKYAIGCNCILGRPMLDTSNGMPRLIRAVSSLRPEDTRAMTR
jgi:hypothetical protein